MKSLSRGKAAAPRPCDPCLCTYNWIVKPLVSGTLPRLTRLTYLVEMHFCESQCFAIRLMMQAVAQIRGVLYVLCHFEDHRVVAIHLSKMLKSIDLTTACGYVNRLPINNS